MDDTLHVTPHKQKFPLLHLEFLPKNVRMNPSYKYANTDVRFTDAVYNDPRHTLGFHSLTCAAKSKLMTRYHNAILKFYRAGPTSEAGRVSIDMVVMGISDRVRAYFAQKQDSAKLLMSTLRKCTINKVSKALICQFVFHFKANGMKGRALSTIKKGWGRFYIREDDPFWNILVQDVTGISI